MTLYGKYINDLIKIEDLSQEEFDNLMIEWYEDYKSRNGEKSFEEFLQYQIEYVI